jgi:hypothetical protein
MGECGKLWRHTDNRIGGAVFELLENRGVQPACSSRSISVRKGILERRQTIQLKHATRTPAAGRQDRPKVERGGPDVDNALRVGGA